MSSSMSAVGSSSKDRFFIVRTIVFFIGIGTLYSWNSCVSAIKYFFYKLGNESLTDAQRTDPNYFTEVQKNFPGYLSMCSMIPLAIFTVVTLFLTKRFSFFKLSVIAGIVIFLMMLLITVMVPIEMGTTSFLAITLLSLITLNACGAILQGSVFGIIATLPIQEMRLALEGQAVAGILTALLKLITLAATDSPTVEGISFFTIALVFLAVMIAGILSLQKVPYFKHHWKKHIDAAETNTAQTVALDKVNDLELKGVIDADRTYGYPAAATPASKSQLQIVLQSLREVLWPGLCVFAAINMTLIIFPTMLSNIVPTSEGNEVWRVKYFTQVVVFLLFNISDWIGRYLAGIIKRPRRDNIKHIFALCCLRYAMIPFFMLMNQQPRKLPAPFAHDAFPIIFIIILGVTNGYALTLGFVYSRSFASPGNEAASGTAMTLYLTFGLASGVAIATGLFQLI